MCQLTLEYDGYRERLHYRYECGCLAKWLAE